MKKLGVFLGVLFFGLCLMPFGGVHAEEYDDETATAILGGSPQEFKAGDTVKLNNVALYASSSTSKIANYKTGTYYIWSDDIKNDRIRITNSKSNVGKAAGVTGWVKVSDLSGDGSISAGDKLTLKNVALYASSTSTKVATHKTGTYYVWSADVKNGRIRITNNKASVGKTACVTGWIDVDDI